MKFVKGTCHRIYLIIIVQRYYWIVHRTFIDFNELLHFHATSVSLGHYCDINVITSVSGNKSKFKNLFFLNVDNFYRYATVFKNA
jgi:hypothetical protein